VLFKEMRIVGQEIGDGVGVQLAGHRHGFGWAQRPGREPFSRLFGCCLEIKV
jgi:hypothetical protein